MPGDFLPGEVRGGTFDIPCASGVAFDMAIAQMSRKENHSKVGLKRINFLVICRAMS